MKYALMFLTLCFLAQGAPANAMHGVALQDDTGITVEYIESMIMANSPMRWSSNRKKQVASILKLYNKKKTPITRKEEQEIIRYLIPNIDDIRRLLLYEGSGMTDCFRKVLAGCIEDVLFGRSDVVENERKIANRVANIIFP